MERTGLYSHDLDWLPPRFRAVRWGVAGVVWTGLASLTGFLVFAAHGHVVVFGKGIAALAVGGYVVGDRAARRVLRGQMRRLAKGAVDVARLPAEPDGELVHVSGRVRARPGGVINSVLRSEPVVWRRVVYSFDRTVLYVHEAAVDFLLVGEHGEPIAIDTSHARLLAPESSPVDLGGDDPAVQFLEALPSPGAAKTLAWRQKRRASHKRLPRLRVREYVLRDGEPVEVLGYKSRTVDVSMHERLERDTPYRSMLRGGQALPLLVSPRPA